MIGRLLGRCQRHPHESARVAELQALLFDYERRIPNGPRVPVLLTRDVRARLCDLLWTPEFVGIGYSGFIDRCCELAETEIAEQQRELSTAAQAQSEATGACS